MKLPPFFDRVPRLRVHDPLAEVLGSAEGGVFEYGYADVVMLAGHSCPTVAATYWLTVRAMVALYPDRLPERGGVRVDFRNDMRDGANGVVAAVVQQLTGAAGETGFKGLAGRFARNGLQRYVPALPLALRFTRLDNRWAVDAVADLTLLPEPPQLTRLLQQCTQGKASPAELAELGRLWQQRVEHLLCDLAYDDGVFVVRPARRLWPSPPSAIASSFPLPLERTSHGRLADTRF
ncbi:hypothetical protein [Ideonella sp. BN130291]|uniref:hypothetical protein n=1 Tax=Ideonella sp. BN130291 TaxID=3112940 RepID=UPI002E25E950|nr:hypothetical protein [Ideonella sp. BN130291]